MHIDTLLSTIILVSFLVTVVMAIGSYAAYKLREARRPPSAPASTSDASAYFERITSLDD